MKIIYLLLFLLFIVGCDSNKKFKKIEINEKDTEITSEKIKKSIKEIDTAFSPFFETQQDIDKKLRKISKEVIRNEKE